MCRRLLRRERLLRRRWLLGWRWLLGGCGRGRSHHAAGVDDVEVTNAAVEVEVAQAGVEVGLIQAAGAGEKKSTAEDQYFDNIVVQNVVVWIKEGEGQMR